MRLIGLLIVLLSTFHPSSDAPDNENSEVSARKRRRGVRKTV